MHVCVASLQIPLALRHFKADGGGMCALLMWVLMLPGLSVHLQDGDRGCHGGGRIGRRAKAPASWATDRGDGCRRQCCAAELTGSRPTRDPHQP